MEQVTMKTLLLSLAVAVGLASGAFAHHTTQHTLVPCGQVDYPNKGGR
jgi:hypothetical protein